MIGRTFRGRSFGRPSGYRTSFRSARKPDFTKYIHKAEDIAESEPMTSAPSEFSTLPIDERILGNITARGYAQMTPIQQQAIRPILGGHDLIGIAHTGTGKTGAFLIPLMHAVTLNPKKQILIVVPTRELAEQIYGELRAFAGSMPIYATAIIGGANMYRQIQHLKRYPHFVIGTPGRLKDLINRKALSLASFDTVVLDEVDRMLDMGFIQDIRWLIALLPAKKQSLFFSATLSAPIRSLIRTISPTAQMVTIESASKTANIDQDIVRLALGQQKIDALHDILNKHEVQKTIIFGRTKRGVDRLSRSLEERGFKVSCIHGDKTQARRNQAIDQFKRNRVSILVATDVAARGIDIDDVTHVINYDQPENYDDYIHRIGRTGRANKKGTALTFIE